MKKNTATTKKAPAKTKSSGKTTARQTANGRPIRREVWGLVCLVFGVIALLGCFGVSSIFTDAVRKLSAGLFGAGYVIFPFTLLIAFVVLMFHDGRPVRLRVFCAFMLTLLVGSMAHTVSCKLDLSGNVFELLKKLYLTGMAGTSGGAVAGLIAQLLSAAISKVGAMLLFIVLLLLCLLTTLNMTIPGIVRAIRQRPRLEYEKPKREHVDPAKMIVDHVAQKQIERTEKKRAAEFDVPVDDVPAAQPKKEKRSHGVISPDQFLTGQQEMPEVAAEPAAEVPVVEEHPAEVSAEVQELLENEPQKIKKEEVQQETILVAQEIE